MSAELLIVRAVMVFLLNIWSMLLDMALYSASPNLETELRHCYSQSDKMLVLGWR